MLLGAAAAAALAAAGRPRVLLPGGTAVLGRWTAHSREFLGIPYARAERWSPPAPPGPATGAELDAGAFGPCCVQPDVGLYIPPTAEDCLSLNLFAPQEQPPAPVPVMMWIHGGGGTTGCSSQALPVLYNGSNLVGSAGQRVMVATLNYRLGPLSALYLPELAAGGGGNLALQDVAAALRWLRANVAAFGGDPQRVTLFGESAGGNMVLALPAVPAAAGLFSGVIAESATAAIATGWVNASVAESRGRQLAARLNCTDRSGDPDLACLRALPAQALADTTGLDQLGAVVDGSVVPQYPLRAYRDGSAGKEVSVVAGSNDPDNFPYCAELPQANASFAADFLRGQLPLWTEATPEEVEEALRDYGVASCSPGPAGAASCCAVASRVMRDAVFTCNAWRLLSAHRRRHPARQWWFTLGCCPRCPSPAPPYRCVCQHTSEIPYVFATESSYQSRAPANCSWGAEDRRYSAELVAQWTAVAAGGVPGAAWLPFGDGSVFSVLHGGEPRMVPWDGAAQCALWERIDGRAAAAKFGPPAAMRTGP